MKTVPESPGRRRRWCSCPRHRRQHPPRRQGRMRALWILDCEENQQASTEERGEIETSNDALTRELIKIRAMGARSSWYIAPVLHLHV